MEGVIPVSCDTLTLYETGRRSLLLSSKNLIRKQFTSVGSLLQASSVQFILERETWCIVIV